jgi:hypothetical protein
MLTRKQLLAKIAKEKKAGTFKGFEHFKQLDIKAVQGVEVTPEILAKVNAFALKPLTAEQIYVRKFLFAHNCVDRDRERFPENLLDDFAATFPGKGFLIGHQRSAPGKALFFDAMAEEMTPEQFKQLTAEDPRLGEGVTAVKVVWAWNYMLNNQYNEETVLNIDAGIYRHVSIGFRASDLVAVKGQYDQTLYYEYVAPGETLEGSLVWLGAQPGATAQKQTGESDGESDMSYMSDLSDIETHQGGIAMKSLFKILAKLFPGKSFTEEGLADEIKEAIEEMKQKAKQALDDAVAPLKAKIAELEPLQTKVKELEPLAADGKAYRDGLVSEYVANKAKLGEVAETPEAQEAVKKVAAGYPVDFLKSEVKHLESRVAEKFPADPQLKGDMRKDKSADGKDGKKKNALSFDDED